MGLLDEAIRDHLELKRRAGADPTEIARAEQEALEPVFPGEPSAAHPDDPLLDRELSDADHRLSPQAEAVPAEHHEQQVVSTINEETVEIDMQAVLDEQHQHDVAAPEPAAAAAEEELLEWEDVARAAPEPPPEPIPGQERLSFE